jgi:hypothetical protein
VSKWIRCPSSNIKCRIYHSQAIVTSTATSKPSLSTPKYHIEFTNKPFVLQISGITTLIALCRSTSITVLYQFIRSRRCTRQRFCASATMSVCSLWSVVRELLLGLPGSAVLDLLAIDSRFVALCSTVRFVSHKSYW